MRIRLVAAALAVVIASTSGIASETTRAGDEAVLRNLKEVLWPRAYAEQDVKLLDSILAPEFRKIDAEGKWSTKNDELEFVRTNKPRYDSLVFTVKRLDVFENGSAIVAGEGTVHRQGPDGPEVVEYQSTNVLIKRDGKWKAVASHVSGVKRVEEPKAAGS
ncbi:MAG: nuclear transport factor 2 family protein [Blastocatellia bacterium]|nr:nuclear transport factor 2 family protein [Blastocatellia bacterium]